MTRRAVVLAALVLAVLVAACAAPTWVLATTSSPSVAVVPLSVTGTSVAPGAGAGALVVGAAALALALGRRWGQRVALVAVAAGGALVAVSALASLGSAHSAALSAALEAVGVATLTGDARLTVWPWIAAALGLAAVGLAVAGGVSTRRWSGPSQRFEQAEGSARSAEQEVPGTAAQPAPGVLALQDDTAVWEALSRGEDPT